MELLQYWKVVQKSIWIIVAILVVVLAGTALYSVRQPNEYESTGTLLLNPSVANVFNPTVQKQVAADLSDSYTAYLKTRQFSDQVVALLAAQPTPVKMSSDNVVRAIGTRLEPNTLFFKITTRLTDPAKSEILLQAVLDTFEKSDLVNQPNDQSAASAKVKQQTLVELQTRVSQLQDQVNNYDDMISDVSAQQPTDAASRSAQLDRLIQLRGAESTLQQTIITAKISIAQLGTPTDSQSTVTSIDQPQLGQLVPSRLPLNMALAFAVGLLLGVGVAFLRDYLDYTIHTPDQLEDVLGLTPVAALGVVGQHESQAYPYGRSLRRKGEKKEAVKVSEQRLVTMEHPKAPASESFRVLRTNIQFSSIDKPIHTIVVTSSVPGEGKSFTASNLAIVMAQAGNRVILVDCDLRKPSQHKLFDLPNQIGFTSLVVNRSSNVEGAIQFVPGVENLAIVTSGPLPPNPSELLNSQQALQVMEQLEQQANIVIYDAPPAGVVTDPIVMATRTDAVLLVISAGTTRRDMIGRVVQALERVNVQMILPVLNRVRARDAQGYYSYGYYYGSDSDTSDSSNGANGANGANGKKPRRNGKTPKMAEPEIAAALVSISGDKSGKEA